MKLNEQIARLRKKSGMTQESLARQLGVTNQAVSKWESGANCPDIELLPVISDLFGVSIDSLFGREAPVANGGTPENVLKAAYRLHARFLMDRLSEMPESVPHFDAERMVESAEQGDWGYTAWCEPEITTVMRRGTVLFSGNKERSWSDADLMRMANALRPLSDADNLRIINAVFCLTVEDEEKYISLAEISEKCGMEERAAEARIRSTLSPYLSEKQGRFRLDGMYMDVMPIVSLLDFK